MALIKFLPGTGRGTMQSMVEGPCALGGFDPSVSASRCHLPVPGRIA
jgi:hypothetical protein